MRVLYLLPFPPRADAPHGGGRVLWHLLKNASLRHRVGIVYLRASSEPDIDDEIRRRCDLTRCVHRPTPGTFSGRLLRDLRLLLALPRGVPMWVCDWHVPAFTETVRTMVAAWRPDVVQSEFQIMGQYAESLNERGFVRVLTVYEPGTDAVRARSCVESGVRRLIYRADAISWDHYESRIFQSMDAIVTFTERDRRLAALQAGNTPVLVIRPGGISSARALDPAGAGLGILFMGMFRHYPNIDAVTRLIRSIFPMVRERCPQATLCIIGDKFPDRLKQAMGQNVTVLGRVPDATPYIDAAAVIVAPITLGGGIRIKVMEALASGKAVVGTRLSAEGLDVVDGEHMIFAENDEDFASAIIGLLEDRNARCTIAQNARRWALSNLDWSRTLDRLDQLYQHLLSR
jgi:polysaccharide biosynthesis protein PslH